MENVTQFALEFCLAVPVYTVVQDIFLIKSLLWIVVYL